MLIKGETELKQSMFIVVDGVESVGKTTLCKQLAELYSAYYIPTNTQGPIAEAVRDKFKHREGTDRSNFTYGIWMLSSIMEAYEDHIKPLLDSGNNVIVDRWLSSLYAYQIYGRDHSRHLNNIFLNAWDPETQHELGFRHLPDLYLYCKASVETIMVRSNNRGRVDSQDTMSRSDRLDLMFKFDKFYGGLKTNKLEVNCEGSEIEVFHNLKEELLRRGYYHEQK